MCPANLIFFHADSSTLRLFVNSFVAVTVLLTYAIAQSISTTVDLSNPTSSASNRNFASPIGGSLFVHLNDPQEMQELPVRGCHSYATRSLPAETFVVSLELKLTRRGNWPLAGGCSLALLPTKVRPDGDDVNTLSRMYVTVASRVGVK
jgi:hypothetical protein